MSGDYKIEVMAPRGFWESVESYASKRDTREEIRRRQKSGEYAGCVVYIRNTRTGWRSSEVRPLESER
jgi:hypothetical protein